MMVWDFVPKWIKVGEPVFKIQRLKFSIIFSMSRPLESVFLFSHNVLWALKSPTSRNGLGS